jgi:hypothetical protein
MIKYISSSRYIRSDSDDVQDEDKLTIEEAFSELIDDATKIGYKMKVSGDIPKIILTTTDREMPRIVIDTIDEGSKRYTFQARLTFPDVYTESMNYADSFESLVDNKWHDVGWFITQLRKFVYDA